MFKLIVKCRKANVTHMLLPSVFVAVHEEKRKEAAQHKHKEREGLEYNRRAVFENRRESLHICQEPIASSHSHLPEEPTRAAHWGKLNKYLRVRQMLSSMRHYGAQLRPT